MTITESLWSAVTCYRFGLRRPVGAFFADASRCFHDLEVPRDGGDRSPPTKALTGQRTPDQNQHV